MNFAEGTVLSRFTTRVIVIWEALCEYLLELLQCICFENTGFRQRFSKYRPLLN